MSQTAVAADTDKAGAPAARLGETGRIVGLDGLRAAAILPVLLVHALPDWFSGGLIGVDLFFVISGYIISRGLLLEHEATGTISIRGFYRRRVRRILPPLVTLIVAVLALGTAIGSEWSPWLTYRAQWLEALAALSSTMNWWRGFGHGGLSYLGHTWSLSFEEQFYLVWPVTLLVLLRLLPRRRVPGLLIGAILLVVVWRSALALGGASVDRTYFGFDTRADALLVGCLLAVVGTSGLPEWTRRWWVLPAAAFAAMLFLAETNQRWLPLGGFTVIAMLAGWLVAAAVNAQGVLKDILSHRVVQWIGLRSYSLYLWHAPALGIVRLFGVRRLIGLPLFFLLSFALAALSYHFIERLFLQKGASRNPGQASPSNA
jgi:peptidoglycan/LPS O-acetylase OafA/YrhL